MTAASDFRPRPSHRWVIVGASAIMLAIAMGMMVNGISSFLIPLGAEFGWQRGDVSFINFAGLVGLALGGIVMGRIADRTATRRVVLFGAVSLGLCLLGAARADALWQFYLLFFLGGLLGAGAIFAPLVANVGGWFTAGVGLAMGIVAAGQALGQGGVPFATALMISAVGWRGALTAMGVITLAVLIPLGLLIRQPPRPAAPVAGKAGDDDEPPVPLSTNAVVVWLSAAVVFCCICMSVPLMHLVPLAQDRGITLEDAGSVLFVMLLAGICGRVAFGRLADMIGAIRAYWVASLWQTALMAVFLGLETLDSFYLFAVVYGFGYGGVMTCVLVCTRVLTPASRRAFAVGMVSFFGFVGHAVGGYQGGVFFDLTGDYTVSYVNAALAGAVNLVIVASLFLTVTRRQAALAVQA